MDDRTWALEFEDGANEADGPPPGRERGRHSDTADLHASNSLDDFSEESKALHREWNKGARPPVLPTGHQLAQYIILEDIGVGGAARVYRAHDCKLDRYVAIKVRSSRDEEGLAKERLTREAQALARFRHANVVMVYDFGEQDDILWIVMEHVKGATLRTWAEAPREWSETLRVLMDVVRGVDAVHAADFVHRDLKPENVMIDDDGIVRVMDFGLAIQRDGARDRPYPGSDDVREQRALCSSERLTREGELLGTEPYVAPERWNHQDAGPAADQFAWSVMAWELLYGQRPFEKDVHHSLEENIVAGRRRPPPRRHAVPTWLRRIIERGLHPEPVLRWPSMAALNRELARGLARARLNRAGAVLLLVGIAAVFLSKIDRTRKLGDEEAARAWQSSCALSGNEIAEVWNEQARARIASAFAASGASTAEVVARRVVAKLDSHAAQWREARSDACMDVYQRSPGSADMFNRSAWCLEGRKSELQLLVEHLSTPDRSAANWALEAVLSMDAIGDCRNSKVLPRQPVPPTHARKSAQEVRTGLLHARLLERAGLHEDSTVAAELNLLKAESLQWPPLLAAAQLQYGRSLALAGRAQDSERALESAYFTAKQVKYAELAAEASIQVLRLIEHDDSRSDDAGRWLKLLTLETSELETEDEQGLRSAELLKRVGAVLATTRQYVKAREALEQALELQTRVLGADHLLIHETLDELADAQEASHRFHEARQIREDLLARREYALGGGHPEVARTLDDLAVLNVQAGNYVKAKQLFERSLQIRTQAFGARHEEMSTSLLGLADIYRSMGRHDEAMQCYTRAIAIQQRVRGGLHPALAKTYEAVANLYLETGSYRRAERLFKRALEIERISGKDPPALNAHKHARARGDAELASPLLGLARVALAVGKAGDAIALAESVARSRVESDAPAQQIAEAHFILARALWDSRRDRPRAEVMAKQVHGTLVAESTTRGGELAEVELWLSTHASR